MIKEIIVINHLGEALTLELANPWKTGIYIKSITGIGPGKASINTTDLASDDGSIFNSARSTERNIVLTLGFLIIPGITNTVEDARQLTYKYFPKKKPITFYILTDNREVYTIGYVESNDPDIFSKEETTMISIICPDPNFYSIYNKSTIFSGIDPMFEFPWSNESDNTVTMIPGIPANKQVIYQSVSEFPDTGDSEMFYFVDLGDNYFDEYIWLPSIGYHKTVSERHYYQPDTIFGDILIVKERNLTYDGDVDVGINIRLHFIGSVNDISIYHTNNREIMKIISSKIESITGSDIIDGDDIYINTNKGNKSIQLVRRGITYNILNALDKNSDWFTISKGDNTFVYTTDYGADNVQLTIVNDVAFEGV